jgi:hypothetical protein
MPWLTNGKSFIGVAIIETDGSKLEERIEAAEFAIHARHSRMFPQSRRHLEKTELSRRR